MWLLQPVDVPGYAALGLRRTYADLALPGALMDRAAEWLRPTGAEWNDKTKSWRFPHSGARLTFGYLETEQDKFRYAGAELQRIAFDELTQFTESQYTFPLSRLRRLQGMPVRPAARGATNPGGIGHDWVHARFIAEATRGDRVFVPARLDDNPSVDAVDYRGKLSLLDSTTRAQLLDGLWVRDSGGLLYRYLTGRNSCDVLPSGYGWHRILGVDLGGSQRTPTSSLVDVAWADDCLETYVARSSLFIGKDVTDIAERIKAWSRDLEYGYETIVVDDGGLGGQFIREFQARHDIPARPAQKADKLGFRKLLNGAFERGAIRVVVPQNEALVAELGSLEWNDRGDDARDGQSDHLTDALLYASRESRAFLSEVAEPRPPPGTPEAWAAEEREMLRRLDERHAQRAESGWWEQDL